MLRALYPGLELMALKQFDGKKRTRLEKLKWTYYLLFKRAEKYSLDLPADARYDMILWPSQGKHYTLQLPVYRRLQEMGISVAFISNTDSVEAGFKKDGVNYIPVITSKSYPNRFSAWWQNRGIINKAKAYPAFQEENHSLSFKEVLDETLTHRIVYDKSLGIFHALIRQFKPAMILFGYCFSTITLSLDRLCRQNGIRSGALQMGRLNYYIFQYSYLDVFYAYGADVAKNTALVNEAVDCVSVGSIKIEITEQTRDRQYVDDMIRDIRNHHKQVGLVAFSGPGFSVSESNHIENLKILQELVSAHPEVYFIIKFHSKDHNKYYKDFEGLHNLQIINHNHPVYQFDIMHLIRNCDFIVSGASTTLIEAGYWLKPALSLDALHELGHISLVEEPFIYRCHSLEEMDAALKSVISNDGVYQDKMNHLRAFSEKTFIKTDTPPTLLVAQDMVKRIHKSTSKLP